MNSIKERKSETVLVRFPKSLLEPIKTKSAETGATVSELIRRAVSAQIAAKG